MNEIEKLVLEKLVIPGQNREDMPQHAELPLSVRKSDVNEMITFSTIGDQQMQRALILTDFETMMGDKESEREWKFFDRSYAKPFSKDALKYELSRNMLLKPEITTQYCAREDALLWALYFKNPLGRIIRNQWSLKYKNIPDFRGYLKSLLSKDQKTDPINLDDQADTKFFNKDSLILWNEKRMYPSDNSVIRTIKWDIGIKMIGRTTIIKDNFTFSISESYSTKRYSDQYLSVSERDEQDRKWEFWCTLGDPTVKFFIETEKVDQISDEEYRQRWSGAALRWHIRIVLLSSFFHL